MIISAKYEKVKFYYDEGVWSKIMVRNAVAKKWITETEYEIITGEQY